MRRRAVPRLADHEQRRAGILAALLRIASTKGLHAASMRTVAAEAGVTVSTVQYYFHTKEGLLFAGLAHLAEAIGRRATPKAESTTAREAVQAALVELIPVDGEQRATYAVFAAYHALALTDPALAEQPYTRRSTGLEGALAERIESAQRAGEIARDRDPAAEAANLLALATGLADSVMANMRTPESALALVRYHLDQLFDA
jgi:TetR/AcrR family transcriptional regulator, transcriptional repressor of bet genes